MTLVKVQVKWSVVLMDRFGPDNFSTLQIKGHVLHRAHAHLKVPGWLLVWNALLTKTLPIWHLNDEWFSNQFDIVSETHLSCDTVGRELWLAILSLLLCPETNRNIRIGKQGYVFILSDFRKWCFDVSFLTSISVSVILTLGKAEFFKQINLRNILFIKFLSAR